MRASEQDRPDVAQARAEWRQRQTDFDPARLVFVDEAGAKTNLTRLYGRAPRGERVHAKVPHSHWKTTTMISAVRLDGSTHFMDNLRPHQSTPTLALIQAAGAETLFLPAYSPDLNPIEKMWSKVKAHLCKTQARTLPALRRAVGRALRPGHRTGCRWLVRFLRLRFKLKCSREPLI